MSNEEKKTSDRACKTVDCCSLSFSQLEVACQNIGYDISCGACAELFFTGVRLHPHDESCKTTGIDKTAAVQITTGPDDKCRCPVDRPELRSTHCPIHGSCLCCHGALCPTHDEPERLVSNYPRQES